MARQQLTNSPQKTAPQGWPLAFNAFTRAIDGSLTGEWGRLVDYNAAGWSGNAYWATEEYGNGSRFIVGITYGRVSYDNSSSRYSLACSL